MTGAASLFPVELAPFIGWAGSKRRLAPRIIHYMPTEITEYHEPFLGAGAIFLAIANRIRRQGPSVFLGDNLPELAESWQVVRDDPEALIECLKAWATDFKTGKEFHFEKIKNFQCKTELERAAQFVFIMRFGYGSLWRKNKDGEINVSYGGDPEKRGYMMDFEAIRAASDALDADDSIVCGDFADIHPGPGAVIYLDPPYWDGRSDSFYGKGITKRFDWADFLQLKQCVRDWTEAGCLVYMSHSDHPDILEEFNFLHRREFQLQMCFQARKNRQDTDCLFMNDAALAAGGGK